MAISKAIKLGRDARTGEFVPIRIARKNPDRYIIFCVHTNGCIH